MIRWLITCLMTALMVAVCYMGYKGGRDERNERAAAGMEAATVKLRAVTAADTIREITVILHELAAAWYSVTDRPLRFGCEAQGVMVGRWTAPTEGSPVVWYDIQFDVVGQWPDTSATWPIPVWADSVRGRVRGIDAIGQVGSWSEWGLWYPAEEQHGQVQ